MVVGWKAMLPYLLIPSSVNGRVESESTRVCVYVCALSSTVTGSCENWLKLISTQCLYGGITSWTLFFSYVLLL